MSNQGDFNANTRHLEFKTDAEALAGLLKWMIGILKPESLTDTNHALGWIDSQGNFHKAIAQGGDALFKSLTLSGLAGNGNKFLLVDNGGEVYVADASFAQSAGENNVNASDGDGGFYETNLSYSPNTGEFSITNGGITLKFNGAGTFSTGTTDKLAHLEPDGSVVSESSSLLKGHLYGEKVKFSLDGGTTWYYLQLVDRGGGDICISSTAPFMVPSPTTDYDALNTLAMTERNFEWNAQHSTNARSGQFAITVNPTNISVLSGYALLKAINTEDAPMYRCLSQDTTLPISPNFPNGSTRYIYAEKDSGALTATIKVAFNTGIFENSAVAILYVVTVTSSGVVSVVDIRGQNTDYFHNANLRDIYCTGLEKYGASGILGVNGDKSFLISPSKIFLLNVPIAQPQYDSRIDNFIYTYRNGAGGYTFVASRLYLDYTKYDDGDGTLGAVATNQWANHWVFREMNTTGKVWVVYGQAKYNSLAEAQLEVIPVDRAPELAGFSTIEDMYQIIVNGAGTVGAVIDLKAKARGSIGSGAPLTEHNNLGGLNTPPYWHLTTAEYSELTQILGLSVTGLLKYDAGTNLWVIDTTDYNGQYKGVAPLTNAELNNPQWYPISKISAFYYANQAGNYSPSQEVATTLASAIGGSYGQVFTFKTQDSTARVFQLASSTVGGFWFRYATGNSAFSAWAKFATEAWADGKFVQGATVGQANGVCPLGADIKVPSQFLPSYVDDVLEYPALGNFPANGETGKIYVALDTNRIYRWSGSVYIEISPSSGVQWGGIAGTLSNQADLQLALDDSKKYNGIETVAEGGTINFLQANRFKLIKYTGTSDNPLRALHISSFKVGDWIDIVTTGGYIRIPTSNNASDDVFLYAGMGVVRWFVKDITTQPYYAVYVPFSRGVAGQVWGVTTNGVGWITLGTSESPVALNFNSFGKSACSVTFTSGSPCGCIIDPSIDGTVNTLSFMPSSGSASVTAFVFDMTSVIQTGNTALVLAKVVFTPNRSGEIHIDLAGTNHSGINANPTITLASGFSWNLSKNKVYGICLQDNGAMNWLGISSANAGFPTAPTINTGSVVGSNATVSSGANAIYSRMWRR